MTAPNSTPWPAAPELELALLGNVARRPDWLDQERLAADDLLHAYGRPWRLLREHHLRGELIDYTALEEVFAQAGQSRTIAFDAWERAADTLVQTLLPVLERLARQRAMLRLAEAFRREGLAVEEDAEVVELLVESAEALRSGRRLRQDVVESRAALGVYLDELGQRREHPGTTSGFAFGLRDLDTFTGGLQRGEVNVLAARPSVGKSALAHQVVRASSSDAGVLLVTPEMSRREVLARMIAQNVGISMPDQRAAVIPAERWEDLLVWAPGFPSFELYDATQPACADITQLVARRAGGPRPVGLVILDHLGWDGGERRRGNEQTHELRGRQMKMLKGLARRYECAVLVLCQLNRNSEDGERMRRPSLSELRASGAIEEDADVVVLLHRETRTARDGEAIVGKQRNGPAGTVQLRWDGEGVRWLDA